jgi:2-desacetyl-2-hydroxyethyl bacteriochlorophyllide A dehydrogenase
MRAINFYQTGKYEYRTDYPVPKVGDTEVLMRVDSCGICGTDIHIYNGEFEPSLPVIPGHEFAGTLEEVGNRVENAQVGDRVTCNPNTICNKCHYCKTGRENLCVTLPGIGVKSDGGFAEYVKIPQRSVYPIPDELEFEEAAFTEPLGCALNGIQQAQIRHGEHVLVIGAGPTALMLIQLAKDTGAAKVTCIAKHRKQIELADELGADAVIETGKENIDERVREYCGEYGPDVIIEAVGIKETIEASLRLAAKGTRIVWFGVAPQELEVAIKPYDVFRKELHISGSFVNPYTTRAAIEMLAAKRVRVKEIITHRFPIDQFDEAMKTQMADKKRSKIMIHP